MWLRFIESRGYGRASIRGYSQWAHRAAYQIFVGPFPAEMDVLHKCDTPSCVNPLHLTLGTHRENMLDMVLKGRSPHKLSAEQVRAIRTDTRFHSAIARDYGVGQSHISRIKSGKRRPVIPD